MRAECRKRAERIAALLRDVPTLSHEIFMPPVANAVPHLLLRYDAATVGKTPLQVSEILRSGSPSIELNPSTGRKSGSADLPDAENAIVVGVWMLQPGEDMIVARRLRDALLKA